MSSNFLEAARHIESVLEAEEKVKILKQEELQQKQDLWKAGRDAALKELTDFARRSPHLVHALFIPAIEGLEHTLLPPEDL